MAAVDTAAYEPDVRKRHPQIAVVDDERSICVALERLIRSAQMDVKIYPSAQDFLDEFEAVRPDCVVLDLHMPRVNGFEVQCRLASRENPPPVIVITGHDTPEARARALKNGASAYLLKPVDDQMLLDAITAAIAEAR